MFDCDSSLYFMTEVKQTPKQTKGRLVSKVFTKYSYKQKKMGMYLVSNTECHNRVCMISKCIDFVICNRQDDGSKLVV